MVTNQTSKVLDPYPCEVTPSGTIAIIGATLHGSAADILSEMADSNMKWRAGALARTHLEDIFGQTNSKNRGKNVLSTIFRTVADGLRSRYNLRFFPEALLEL
jgi:hypothetical protein